MGRFVFMCFFLRNYGHARYENGVSQSHDEEEGCVHNDVYIVNRISPAEYEHQDARDLLHQSNGGRPDVDQPQRTPPTRVWSEPHQGSNRFAKEGGKLAISEEGVIFL